MSRTRRNVFQAGLAVIAICLQLTAALPVSAQVAAGYSDYYIPGDEVSLWTVFSNLDVSGTTTMHCLISVTGWSDNTKIYYDHWENGLTFDPANPDATADEIRTVALAGGLQTFESANIPTAPRGLGIYYDGGDRIYVAGGTVTVTRASWIENRGVGAQAAAWEVYPVKPQLTTYVTSFGENSGFNDFQRVYVLIQATADNTTFTVDLDRDGNPDVLNQNRDADKTDPGDTTTVSLQRGQTFLLDRVSACRVGPDCLTAPGTLNVGTLIQGNNTLQVKYVAGMASQTYRARGFSSFPRGLWTKDYYAPLDEPANARTSDYYLYNPSSTSAVTVTWTSNAGSGSFNVGANAVVSFRTATAGSVPLDSALYFQGSDVFWGVGVGDSNASLYEWGFSLLPSTMLYSEHFLGWAPDCNPVTPGTTDMGIFLTVAQDNTRVFVDSDNNGTVDQTFTLNRLQSQYIVDPDGDLSQAHIWATGPFTLAYGQDADTARTPGPPGGLDLGYVAIPGTDFISLVLTTDKSVSPQVVPSASGSVATFTIKINSVKYSVDGVVVTDYLPPNWDYLIGTDTTTITKPDKTTLSGAGADPTRTGSGPYTLSWTSAQLGTNGTPGMAENQEVVITFTARTTAALGAGTLSQNRVKAVGTRTFGSPSQTQTFTTTDFIYVVSGALQIVKSSGATNPSYPGDRFTYTVTVTNPAGGAPHNKLSLYDAVPTGAIPVPGTTVLSRSSVADAFTAAAFTNNNGTRNWTAAWTESDSAGAGAGVGNIRVTGGELRLNNAGAVTTQAMIRGVDLTASGATQATLSYDYRTAGALNASDVLLVQYRVGAGAWNLLATYTSTVSGSASHALTLASPADLTEVRFAITSAAAYTGAGSEYFYADNVSITYNVNATGGDPPDLLNAKYLYTLLASQTLTATFDVTVKNPFPTGQTTVTNSASVTSAGFPIAVLSNPVTDNILVPTSQSASVSGKVWTDINGDGVWAVGEPGIPSVEVTLWDQYGAPLATAITDATGRYVFPGVPPGTGFSVQVTGNLPAGLTQTSPAGRTDNRTNTFALVAGQSYTAEDLGYRAANGTAIFGDLTWVDVNANGVRDSGEISLKGVTLTLYRDANGDGNLNTGVDTYIGTTTSAANGSYLFTGATATGTETYFVVATIPVGYAATGSTTVRFQNVAEANAYMTADFGFQGTTVTTYTIADRIWKDINANGVYDGGESGFSGITVELLDTSLNIIGTTTSAADGTFTFAGMVGAGADYTVRISDTGNLLANYYGTTAYATARARVENNLVASIDRRAAPSFGFWVSRSIGDTVYTDLNGNGVQDAGEPGMSGIAVSLFQDLDNDGVIDVGEPQVGGSVTTDSNGNYLFSGLANGNYIVSVPIPPGYSFTGLTADSDGVTAGIQLRAAMVGGISVLTVDYAFRALVQRTVAGTLWNDLANYGVIDGGENGLAGVTLDILSGATVVATLTTDASGAYSLAGLAAGVYTVRVTDTGGVLSGYLSTYEKTEGTTSPFNLQESVDLTGGNVTDVHFGYKLPAVTYAAIAAFTAAVVDGSVTVEWRTSLEVGTAGFHLLRRDPVTERYLQVNDSLLPGLLVSPQGGTYRFRDDGAPLQGRLAYKVVEIEVRGTRREYGPYVVSLSAGDAFRAADRQHPRQPGRPFERWAASMSAEQQAKGSIAAEERRTAVVSKRLAGGNRLKITTREAGLHYLAAARIAGPLGLTAAAAAEQILMGNVALTNRGRTIPTLPAAGGAGISFLAEPVGSSYTDENVYWLALERGVKMPTRKSAASGFASGSFQETLHREEDRQPLPVFFQDPEGDFWCWDYVFAGYPGLEAKSFTVAVPGVEPQGPASLSVHLQGGSDTEAAVDHHAIVSWNGVAVGEAHWAGTSAHELVIPLQPGEVLEGENILGLTALLGPGVPFSIVYLDSIALTYERRYEAIADELTFPAPAGAAVTVTGFSTPELLLLDVTTPAAPVRVQGATVAISSGGTYKMRFATAAAPGERRYLVTAPARAKKPLRVVSGAGSTLDLASNSADYVLIAPAALVPAAHTLAGYRRGQGLTTLVVGLEEIYDTFNHGIVSPLAIREFLDFATSSWQGPPRYVTLVGRGTFDYKDRQRIGDNLVPPLLARTPYGLVVSDTRLADLAGDDGVPEIAVGRLPVQTTQELLDYVGKVQAHESAAALTRQRRVLMAADNPDAAGQFTADSDAVAALVPADYPVSKAYLETMSAAAGRLTIVEAVNAGVLLFNYIGHGGLNRLADEDLFSGADVAALTNADRLPVFLGMTCSVGNFAIPGYPSLAETLLLKEGGGAYAVWSPSGLSDNDGAVLLDKAFFRGVFSGEEQLIGEIVVRALREFDVSGSGTYRRSLFNLLGEPVSRLP